MEYFVPIRSKEYTYRMSQLLFGVLGIAFIIGGLSAAFSPDTEITLNEEVQKTNFDDSYPFLLIGFIVFSILFIYSKKLSLADVSHHGIKLSSKKNQLIPWSEIDFIEVKHFLNDHCIRVHTKIDRYFNIVPDKVNLSFGDAFNPENTCLKSKMWQKINEVLTTK